MHWQQFVGRPPHSPSGACAQPGAKWQENGFECVRSMLLNDYACSICGGPAAQWMELDGVFPHRTPHMHSRSRSSCNASSPKRALYSCTCRQSERWGCLSHATLLRSSIGKAACSNLGGGAAGPRLVSLLVQELTVSFCMLQIMVVVKVVHRDNSCWTATVAAESGECIHYASSGQPQQRSRIRSSNAVAFQSVAFRARSVGP